MFVPRNMKPTENHVEELLRIIRRLDDIAHEDDDDALMMTEHKAKLDAAAIIIASVMRGLKINMRHTRRGEREFRAFREAQKVAAQGNGGAHA